MATKIAFTVSQELVGLIAALCAFYAVIYYGLHAVVAIFFPEIRGGSL